MSGSDLVLFDGSPAVPAPLSLRRRRCPFNSVHSVIVVGPPGAVELQIRPALLDAFGGGMSLEYHSRQPMPGAETHPTSGCEVLDGATCYHDGNGLGSGNEFERWLRARDGQAIVDELVRRHQGTTWTLDGLDDEDPDVPLVLDVPPGTSPQLPAGEVPPWA
ncbi:hypothetical protein [Amycolatopsis magusensis]|uniref:hypothetical protein n=1 Tax=Amycolatopsis magusensis TaxID=882444 RepID=UPI0037992C21